MSRAIAAFFISVCIRTGRWQRERARKRGERVAEEREEGGVVMGGGGRWFAQEPGEPPELDGWPVTSLHSGG